MGYLILVHMSILYAGDVPKSLKEKLSILSIAYVYPAVTFRFKYFYHIVASHTV
jgi:hypothetical protein